MKIGFYDSGLGGIKTLKDIIDMGLKEEIYFLADEKNKPYGTKTAEEVKKIAIENVQTLVDLGCKIIVVACNTATSVAIEPLREKFRQVEIIGTEPAVKLAVKEQSNKRILVIATTITVNGEKLHKLINSLDADEKIDLLATDKLVKLIEDENFTHNQKEVNEYIYEFLKPYNLAEYSHIILGCTHFPIVKDNIQEIVKNYGIKVIDGNEGIGRNLFNKIMKFKKENVQRKDESKLEVKIINTLPSKVFERRTKEILQEISSENSLFLEKIWYILNDIFAKSIDKCIKIKYNTNNICYQEWTRDSALRLHSNLFKLGANTDQEKMCLGWWLERENQPLYRKYEGFFVL